MLVGPRDLRADRVRELRRREQRAEHRRDRRVVLEVDAGQHRDERVGRIVGHESHRELVRDALRRRRVVREVRRQRGDDGLAAGVRAVGVGEAEHLHGADPVVPGLVGVLAGVGVDAGAGEDARGIDHAFLAVRGVDADGVQLEQLAPLVLVGVLRRRLAVVEIREHRRVLGDGEQQVAELAEGVRADRVGVVRPRLRRPVLEDRDVEVVAPEVLHHREQLALAPQCADREVGEHRLVLLPAVDVAVVDEVVHAPDRRRLVDHRRGVEALEEGVAHGVVDGAGVELLLDPRGVAEALDVREAGGVRAVRRAAQQVPRPVARRVVRRHRGERRGRDHLVAARGGVLRRGDRGGGVELELQVVVVPEALLGLRPRVGDLRPLLAAVHQVDVRPDEPRRHGDLGVRLHRRHVRPAAVREPADPVHHDLLDGRRRSLGGPCGPDPERGDACDRRSAGEQRTTGQHGLVHWTIPSTPRPGSPHEPGFRLLLDRGRGVPCSPDRVSTQRDAAVPSQVSAPCRARLGRTGDGGLAHAVVAVAMEGKSNHSNHSDGIAGASGSPRRRRTGRR